MGFSLYATELSLTDHASVPIILSGLDEFREHLGGILTITLLNGIGQAMEVNEMQTELIIQSVKTLKELSDRKLQPF